MYIRHLFPMFSFFLTDCQTKAKEPSLLNCLPIPGKQTDRFMLFSGAFVQKETQTASFRI